MYLAFRFRLQLRLYMFATLTYDSCCLHGLACASYGPVCRYSIHSHSQCASDVMISFLSVPKRSGEIIMGPCYLSKWYYTVNHKLVLNNPVFSQPSIASYPTEPAAPASPKLKSTLSVVAVRPRKDWKIVYIRDEVKLRATTWLIYYYSPECTWLDQNVLKLSRSCIIQCNENLYVWPDLFSICRNFDLKFVEVKV